jgi:hypothetical protein
MFSEYLVFVLRHRFHLGSIALCLYKTSYKPNIPGKYRRPTQRIKNRRQIRQVSPVKMLKEFSTINRTNIKLAKAIPIFQANFFCFAPTYSGTCLLTINRPIISVGEYRGLINTRMSMSVRNTMMTYFIIKKFPSNRIIISEMSMNTNSIPAEALISRSFRTGMVYPSTFSPN